MPLSKISNTNAIDAGVVNQAALASNVAGTGPAFSAYANAYQTITQNVITKAVFQVEDFDTNNNFASSTFTPTVAGYYQINANITFEGTVSRNYNFQVYIYKNGALYNYNVVTQLFTGSTNNVTICTNSIISMNGSTDYVEIYVFSYDYTAGGNSSLRGSSGTRSTAFSGSLVRSA